MKKWDIEFNLSSRECPQQVKNFSMRQQALSRELLEAKPLGICKTCISTNPVLKWIDQDSTLKNGRKNTRLNTPGNDVSRGML